MPNVMIRLGEDPRGFPAKVQFPSGIGRSPEQVATQIAVWFTRDPTFGPALINRIMAEVHNATSYKAAEAAVLRVEALGKLSDPLLDELGRAYLDNDQLYPDHIGSRVVQRIFKGHKRPMPTMAK